MKRRLQINVLGTEPSEHVKMYNDLIRCNICIDGRICTFWTTEANYKALIFDGFFIREDNCADQSGVIYTTKVYEEEIKVENGVLPDICNDEPILRI